MHLWLHNGAKRSNLGPVKQACNEIRSAVHLKPDAHFGREKYQLKLMEWVAYSTKPQPYFSDYLGLDDYTWEGIDGLKDAKMPDALQGLSGLIMLGNAWESVDVFYALQMALGAHGDAKPSYYDGKRVEELIDKGKGSLAPGAKRGKALKDQAESDLRVRSTTAQGQRELDDLYTRLRADGEKYQVSRTAYMMPRLQAGQHPDTDPQFWRDWQEPPTLDLQLPSDPQKQTPWGLFLGFGAALVGMCLCGLLTLRRIAISREWHLPRSRASH